MMTDEQLNYWADHYQRLNQRYRLSTIHHFSFEQFLQQPEYYLRWIPFYGDNAALFARSCGGRVLLSLFLTDPELIIQVLLSTPVYDERENPRPLLAKQRQASYLLDFRDMAERRHPCREKRLRRISGGRLIEPMKKFEPTAKYKSRGGHLCYR